MLSTPIRSVIATTFLLTALPLNVVGQETGPVTLVLEVGAEYDNNITVDALDLTSQRGDGAFIFGGDFGYDFIRGDDNHFKLGVNFSQSLHFELAEFDLQTQGASLEAGTKFNDVDLAVGYNFYNVRLGNEDFLQMHVIRPSLTTMLTPTTLFLGSYEYMKQNFQQPELFSRDSSRHSADLKTYFLLGKGRTINIGYKISSNDAVAAQLDYWGHLFTVGFKVPLDGFEGSKFTGRYRYNQKNYTNITPALGEKRLDKRHSVRLALEMPLQEQFTGKLQYEYTDSTSNFEALNFTNHLISFNIIWER